MINDKRFDFSEETNIKADLLLKIRRKFMYEKKGAENQYELSDDELKLVAGGQTKNCPFGGNCSSCENNKDGKCTLI